jgi:hypothetical protein
MRLIRDIFRSYAQLDASGRHVGGTDKSSNHDYGDAYESLFLEFDLEDTVKAKRIAQPHIKDVQSYRSTRRKVKLMMEIGVADGSSLLAWSEVFPNARCVGMDIHVADKIASGRYNNTEFHLGDQCSKEDCERAAGGRQFDVIVEDATHVLSNSLLTLLYMWPFVRPGGLYIVEEFANIGALRDNIRVLWPNIQIVDTQGPFGGVEPLVVFRKPL